jgi:uncharacterized membrane protein (DUF485 family)
LNDSFPFSFLFLVFAFAFEGLLYFTLRFMETASSLTEHLRVTKERTGLAGWMSCFCVGLLAWRSGRDIFMMDMTSLFLIMYFSAFL